MTISQRLTRAGLTFVLLGSVAAALPQQSGAAMADDPCTLTSGTLKIVQGVDKEGAGSANFTQSASSQIYTSFFKSKASDEFFKNGKISVSSITGFTVQNDNSSQVTLDKTSNSASRSAILTDTYTFSGVTYTAISTVTYPL